MPELSDNLQAILQSLPHKPGIYLHKDAEGHVLYVGKAASLHARVRQYFVDPSDLSPKNRALVAKIADIEYIVVGSAVEALILENEYIKRHQPRYNVRLRDDKNYPYALDRTPCGSSSGSATAVAAGLAAVSVGTETDGSILCPASVNSVVGIKPTVGLTSRSGVIPIAHSQDTVGPFGRSVMDAALLLGALTGADARDPATAASEGRAYSDYRQFLAADGLRGARIGVAREQYFGNNEKADALVEEALARMRELGAVLVDPANIPTAKAMHDSSAEMEVMLTEFKADLNAYLAGLGPDVPVTSLAALIAFNAAHADEEMPYFGQEILEMAEQKGSLTEARYLAALAENHRLARQEGIDAVMDAHQLDALVMPTGSPPWKFDRLIGDTQSGGCSQPAALAGYPAISVPAGYTHGLPVGITFMGRAFSEPVLLRLAYAYEQATQLRQTPRYIATTP